MPFNIWDVARSSYLGHGPAVNKGMSCRAHVTCCQGNGHVARHVTGHVARHVTGHVVQRVARNMSRAAIQRELASSRDLTSIINIYPMHVQYIPFAVAPTSSFGTVYLAGFSV